jgi:hypothetical protein
MNAMKTLLRYACLAAASLVTACDGGQGLSPEETTLLTQESPLTTATSQGCPFTLSYATVAGFPPTYNVVITRGTAASCNWPAASAVIANSTQVPSLWLVANNQGVAASYTIKSSFSGSSPVRAEIKHIAPDTLATVRTGSVAVYLGQGSVGGADLSLEGNGSTLFVKGSKGGPLSPTEPSGYGYYLQVYRNFFTSTEAPITTVY